MRAVAWVEYETSFPKGGALPEDVKWSAEFTSAF